VADFCLSPQARESIALQIGLLDRMLGRLRLTLEMCGRADVRCEARLRCIACAWSSRCAALLATPHSQGHERVASFCANARFFEIGTATRTATANLQGGSP